jgi:hypothetical protein
MRSVVALALALLLSTAAAAQTHPEPMPASSASTAVLLDTVTVSGVQPGPGLWKVTKGSHVMWVLGTLSTLPEGMQFRSQEVEQAIAGSQLVLKSPSVSIKPNVGFFGKLFLLPALINVKNDPQDRPLQSVVPPADYARWLVVKARYIGSDRSIERQRPIFAALTLYRKTLKKIGLKESGVVADDVAALAARHNVPVQSVKYRAELEDPRGAIKIFKASTLDDVQCFSQTVRNIDTRLDSLTGRANAWAVGDIAELRKLIEADRIDLCLNAVTESGFTEKLGLGDLVGKMQETWLAAVQASMATNAQTFALLPMEDVLSAKGMLAKLQARGYTVTAPDADDDDAPAAAASSPRK